MPAVSPVRHTRFAAAFGALIITVCVGAAAISSCSARGEANAGSTTSAGASPTPSPEDLTTVFASLRWSDSAARSKLDEAQYRGYWACMASRGFDFAFEPPATTAISTFDRRWGVRDDHEAATWAFGLPGTLVVDQSESAEFRYREQLSPQQRTAFDVASVGQPNSSIEATITISEMGLQQKVGFTMSAESCSMRGIEAAYGSIDRYMRFEGYRQAISYALFALDSGASASADVVDALHDWSTCMHRRGYPSAVDPTQLAEEFGSSLTPEATAAARDHVSCLDESQLYERWQSQLAADALHSEPGLLAAARELEALRSQIVEAG